MSVREAHPITIDEQTSDARSDYWLEHCEGFRVFAPKGRVGLVALVLSSEEGVDGLVIRTGLFGSGSVFVPAHEVGSVTPRTQRVELLVAPRVPRARISDFVRELIAPAAEPSPRGGAAAVLNGSGGSRRDRI